MKNKNFFSRMSGWLRATLILSLVFLALGLGTLGSVVSVGKGYVLPVKSSTDDKKPCIVLNVTLPDSAYETDENGDETARPLYYKSIYVNIGAIYGESGKNSVLRIYRGSRSTSEFYNFTDLTLCNFYENVEEGKESAHPIEDSLCNWVRYDIANPTSWKVTTYPFIKLTAETCNLLINEVVFVASELNADESGFEGREYILDTGVYYDEGNLQSTLLPFDVSMDEEVKRAEAVDDHPQIPSGSQSSYFRYGEEEIYTLLTISEMRLGRRNAAGSVYHIDRVYNSLGTDLVALGVGIFGMSPFGLRFMPFLASFGILAVGALFVRKLTGSEKAGFVFALLYALSGAGFSLGHFGTPLTIGVFFFTAALYFTFKFFKDGMKKADLLSAVPALLGGLFGAAAICVNGAYVIPALLLVGIMAAGLVRSHKAACAALDGAIDEVEEYEKTAPADGGDAEVSEPRKKLAKALADRRMATALPAALFFVSLIVGTYLIAILSALPMYFTYVKAYDNPLAPKLSIFYFLWKAFAGGFAGENYLNAPQSAWSFFYVLFKGTGEMYAVTAAGFLISGAALLAGIAGVVIAILGLVRRMDAPSFKEEIVPLLMLFGGFVLALATAAFAKGGLGFLLIASLFLFVFAARAAASEEEGKLGTAVKVLSYVCLAALVLFFALFAVFTFSIPTAGFLAGLAG